MKRFLGAVAVSIAAYLAASCNDYNNTFQSNTGATLTFLSPANAVAGGPDFTLTVNGFGFVAQTVVQWNGQNRTTTPVKDSNGNIVTVTAKITAADIAKSGTAFVQTVNPHSGSMDNGLSNAVAFLITASGNPIPSMTSISPTSAAAKSADLTLTVVGMGFVPTSDPSGGSIVHWNNGPMQSTLSTTNITSTQITATVPAALLATAGTANVSVFNPPPGGGGSNSLTFTITTGPVAAQGASEDSPAISADGRYVAYTGEAGDHTQVYVHDTCVGADADCQPRSTLVSAAADGVPGNDDSRSPSISADGRYLAFSSAATNLLSESPAGRQVYLRDTCSGAPSSCKPAMQLISTDPGGALTGSENVLPSISSSGRFVAFVSVVPSHTEISGAAKASFTPNSGYRQVFVRDTCLGAQNCTPSTKRISLQPGDAPVSGAPARPALSGNSRRLALAGRDATLLTRSVAIDDRIFLALIGSSR